MAEKQTDAFVQLEQTDNPALKQKRDAMHENTELYAVKPGDTIASIAQTHGIEDYNDLLELNRLIGHNLEVKGKNGTRILIRPWDPERSSGDRIFIPKNNEQFRADIEGVKKISEAIIENKLVAEGNREALKKEINEGIFPKYRQSLGMHRLNDGLLGNMQSSLHIGGPRQVDPRFEDDASCAHYYRQELRSAFNIGDMPKEWKKFMNTGSIDAWELPARLLRLKNDGKPEFVRKENFMNYFDTSKFGARTSPIASGKEDEYVQRMIALNDYLRENANAVNTAIPVYYKHSRYQLQGLLQAHAGGERHYNTHMMRYIGTTPSVFSAYEWGEVHPDGTITPFGGDRKHFRKEAETSKEKLAQERTVYEDHKRILLEHVKNEFATRAFIIDGKIGGYVRIWQERQEIRTRKGQRGDDKSPETVKEELARLFSSGDIAQICSKLSGIIDYPVSDEDARYLIGLQRNKRKATEGMKRIEETLANAHEGQYPLFDKKDYAVLFSMDERLSQALSDYNSSALRASGYTDTIRTNEEKMKSEKKIPVTEYLLNFLQQRADYGESAIKAEGRRQIAEGLAKYAGAVSMKVNGKLVDIAAELKKPRKGQIAVHPEDMIELSGPVMSDGFHIHTLKDPVEREKMQGRQRFFFELLATQTFFPSETIEPTPGSLMHRTEFRATTDAIKTKGTYSLNRGDTLEHAIKRLIPVYERAEFEGLDPDSAEYEQRLQKHYALQIKGLQMLGLMQSEDILNPGAVKINEAIPYFDTTDISKKYSDYIQAAKAKKLAEGKETAPYKEYLDVQVFPSDTYMNLFARIAKNLENYASHFDKYPNIQYIGRLSEPLRREFLEQYIDSAIKSDESATWEKLLTGKVKPGTKFMLHLAQVDKIAERLRGVSYMRNVDNQLRNLDREIIDFIVPVEQSRDIVKTSMMIESYDWLNSTGIRKFGKRMFEEHPFLELFHPLNSVGDFQIRIKDLKNGWNEEWPNRKQVERAIAHLKSPSLQKRIDFLSQVSSSNKSIIEQDKSIVGRIKIILSKTELEPRDFEMLTNDLIRLARIDDETGSNVIGKSIGASLDADSFGVNFQKVWWMLERSGEDMEALRNDKGKSRVCGQAVLLAHNLGEKKVFLGFTENYIIRLLEKINSANGNNTALQYPKLKTSALSGSIHYGLNTFVMHIQSILGNQGLESRWGSPEEQVIFEKLRTFNTQITEAMQKPEKEHEKGVINAAYALLSDKDLRSALEQYSYDPTDPKKRISASLLPNPEEFSGNSFRNVFFNYIRKGEEIEKRAMEKEEMIAKNAREENIASK